MGVSDDWQWFWAGEGGRDRLLRDEVEGLHERLSSASAQTSRLSSQLSNLTGSIESRLNALSRAFDAYVELGDVREELAAYEEPAAVRREVMAAIEALAGGRTAHPIEPRAGDYWLPYAMNAVIRVVADPTATTSGDGDDLVRARELAPEADLFVVAACGALGHGAAVADLLPGVLTADEELTSEQQIVWRAAASGAYGELSEGLAAAWRPQLDREPVASWSGWVAGHGATPSAGISWLRTVVSGPPAPPAPAVPPPSPTLPPPPTSTARPTDGLRAVVSELIGRGMPAEADLLRRARELRTLIENPSATKPSLDAKEPVTVTSEVRWALAEPQTTPSVRATLLAWVAPALRAVVDALVTEATTAPATRETLRGGGGVVVVTSAGADPAGVATSLTRLAAAYQVSGRPLVGWAVGAGIAVLATVVLAVAGSGWAWLFAVGAVVAVMGTIRQYVARRATERAGAEARERLQQSIAEATARVDSAEQRRTALLVQLTGEADDVRARLASPALPDDG